MFYVLYTNSDAKWSLICNTATKYVFFNLLIMAFLSVCSTVFSYVVYLLSC